jgi:hypothetical protein
MIYHNEDLPKTKPSPAAMLDDIAILRDQLNNLITNRESLLTQAIPQDVRAVMDGIRAEFDPKIDAASAHLAAMETSVKNAVLEQGSTVKGEWMIAVFNGGKTTWDTAQLEGFAAALPAGLKDKLLTLKKTGAPFVTIRAAR